MMNTLRLLCIASFTGIVTATSAFCAPANGEPLSEIPVLELAKTLEEVQGKTPTKNAIGRMIALWQKLPEPHKGAMKNDIVAMSCAGYLAINDMEMFGKCQKYLPDQEAFIDQTMDRCTGCHGTGTVTVICPRCGGSGKCPSCRGSGRMAAPSLAGMGAGASRACPSCDGKGRCGGCHNGQKNEKHSACEGSGRVVSKRKSLNAFETHRRETVNYINRNAKAKWDKDEGAAVAPGNADIKFPADDFCDAHTQLYKDLCAGASKAWCEKWIQKKNLKKSSHYYEGYYEDGDTSIKLIFDGKLEVLTAIVCRFGFEAPVTLDDIEAKYRKQFGTAFSDEEIKGQVDYDGSQGGFYHFVRTDVLRMSDGDLQVDVKSHYGCREKVKIPGRMGLEFRELELSSVRFNAALAAHKEKEEAEAEKAKREAEREKVSKALDF